MTFNATLFRDKLLLAGWTIAALSALVFVLTLNATVPEESYFGVFLVHFVFSVGYYLGVLLSRTGKERPNLIHYRLVNLVLFLISAYALNRCMEVFSASPTWFCVVLVVVCINYLLALWFDQLATPLQYLVCLVMGAGFVVFLYLALYLLPLYLASAFAMLGLGISFHTFVPVLFCITTLVLVARISRGQRKYWIAFSGGAVGVVAACIVYISLWTAAVDRINKAYAMALMDGEDKLPVWVQVAQHIEADAMTENILKTGFIFRDNFWEGDVFWRMPRMNVMDEQQVHDPLNVLSGLFTDPVHLSIEERVKILKSQHDARHQTLERLWAGDNLKTSQVITNVRVWPDLHLAYTEKLITVSNNNHARWSQPEEAIYTFHMPEGAVVTSLSLWIEGKEEKGILTTRGKADTAYKTIVGREARDPSVVHWQEGNTVSVRVFPVPASGTRIFKIGVTTPLRKQNWQVLYDNIWFDGPDAAHAEELVKVDITGDPQSMVVPAEFSENTGTPYRLERRYKPVWTLGFRDPGLRSAAFSFNGYNYRMMPYHPVRMPAAITDVYLDVNKAWTRDDVEKVWETVKEKRVWTYDQDDLIAVTAAGKEALFTRLRKKQFSLFPFHLVGDREKSLVITKGDGYSPNLDDLQDSRFIGRLRSKADDPARIRLYDLGAQLPPYLRTLKEFRLFDYEKGDLAHLGSLIREGKFVKDSESSEEVIIHEAGLVITRAEGTVASSAPDHLMRLFAYNQVMQQLKGGVLKGMPENEPVVAMAREAYVVSPVSSLIVLETQRDYDRFNIKDGDNSLQNASMKNKGAVPEPGEWALIVLAAAFLIFFVLKFKIL